MTVSSSSSDSSTSSDNTNDDTDDSDCLYCTSGCNVCQEDADESGLEIIYKFCTRWKWKNVWDPETGRFTSVYERCGEPFTDEFNFVGACEGHAAHEE